MIVNIRQFAMVNYGLIIERIFRHLLRLITIPMLLFIIIGALGLVLPGLSTVQAQSLELKKIYQEMQNLYNKGAYKQAINITERGIELSTDELGATHRATISLINNLGVFYKEIGDLEKAEEIYQQALKLRRENLGPQHLDVAQSLNNLAVLYVAIGQTEKVEPLYLQALAIREDTLDPYHPDVAQILNNLGVLYDKLERYEEAEDYFVETLDLLAASSNEEALNLLKYATRNLAELYNRTGRPDEAEVILIEAGILRTTHKESKPDDPISKEPAHPEPGHHDRKITDHVPGTNQISSLQPNSSPDTSRILHLPTAEQPSNGRVLSERNSVALPDGSTQKMKWVILDPEPSQNQISHPTEAKSRAHKIDSSPEKTEESDAGKLSDDFFPAPPKPRLIELHSDISLDLPPANFRPKKQSISIKEKMIYTDPDIDPFGIKMVNQVKKMVDQINNDITGHNLFILQAGLYDDIEAAKGRHKKLIDKGLQSELVKIYRRDGQTYTSVQVGVYQTWDQAQNIINNYLSQGIDGIHIVSTPYPLQN